MNYEKSVRVKTSQEKAFKAVAGEIDNWWGRVDNPVIKVGDEFSIFFGKTVWRFVITEFSPYNKITWKCIKAEHYHEGLTNIKEEWLNTDLYWTFEKNDYFVEISLLHKGLTPDLNCYKVCESAWDFFVPTSLKSYLETGRGSPYFEE